MAINLSNYLNNQQVGQTGSAVSQAVNQALSGQAAQGKPLSAGNQMLQNMLAGETFSGTVLGIKDNMVSLGLSNGTVLTASLADNVNIQAGQNITFIVEENQNNHIVVKPMAANEQQAFMIGKVLDGAGLPLTKDNIAIVKELLSLNMPVHSDMINEMIHQATAFPDTDYHTLANMLRLEIPINAENIMQYEAYTRFEHNMSNNMERIGDAVVDGLLQSLSGNEAGGLTPQTAGELINTLYNSDGTEIKSMPMSDKLSDAELMKLADNLAQLKGEGADELINLLKDGKMSARQFIQAILDTDLSSLKNADAFKTMLDSDFMKNALHQVINETMKLVPEDVKKENAIPEYYNRMKKTLEEAGKILDGNGSEVQKEMNQVKANIDFMNDLNKNMTYFQMPVKFSESEGNGELYVFTNKKALNNNSDNVSALLHLDMENLGPVDVYVKLAGKNVSTNFCLETEEMLDFVYSHIDELNARLERLGYSCHFEMNISKQEEEKFDFEKDFIEKDIKKTLAGQYIFDTKI